jgi:hypothetical protein
VVSSAIKAHTLPKLIFQNRPASYHVFSFASLAQRCEEKGVVYGTVRSTEKLLEGVTAYSATPFSAPDVVPRFGPLSLSAAYVSVEFEVHLSDRETSHQNFRAWPGTPQSSRSFSGRLPRSPRPPLRGRSERSRLATSSPAAAVLPAANQNTNKTTGCSHSLGCASTPAAGLGRTSTSRREYPTRFAP